MHTIRTTRGWSAAALAAATLAIGASAAPADARGPAIGQGRHTLYVSPRGNDGHAGTKHKPLRTLARAQEIVRTLNDDMRRDIVVRMYGGTYRLNAPLKFTAADSGTNDHTVVYEAVPGERPVVSGARRVTGWKLYDAAKGIYRAHVGAGVATRQLYVDGHRAIRARGADNPPGFQQTATGFTAPDDTLASWPDAADAEVVGRVSWRQYRCGIESVTGRDIRMEQPCWDDSHKEASWINFPGVTWIENAYELLDSPREWYLDRRTGDLFYKPAADENLATADVELPVAQQLVDSDGSVGAPVHDLAFRGITFAYATWNQPSTPDGYAPVQAGVHLVGPNAPTGGWNGDKTPGQISFAYDRRITFERDVFTHLGAYALDLGTGTQGARVVGNRFEDLSSGAVELGGTQVVDHHPDDPRAVTRDNAIDDNAISATGQEHPGAVGIFLGYVAHSRVEHNELTGMTYSGISMGWGWGSTDAGGNIASPGNSGQPIYDTPTTNHDNTIQSNYVADYLTSMRDGAAVYTLGASPGSVIGGNYLLRGHSTNGAALYPDEGSADDTWSGNVLADSHQWLKIWTPSIHDLLVTGNFTDNPAQTVNGTRITMADNTVVDGDHWPAEACAAAAHAGLEPAYADVRSADQPAPEPLC